MSEVHVIVPSDIDDPARPSGGNTYDRRVCEELAALGWTVHEHRVPDLAHAVEALPDGALVLLDGLIAAPEVLVPHARRLRQVVLVHMPRGDRREGEMLQAATAVLTTSGWAKRRLEALHALPCVHVAEPGVDAAELASGTEGGDALLCVASLTPGKGYDVLLDGLAATADLAWRCACVGSLVRDPACAEGIRRRVRNAGLDGRVDVAGPRTGPELDRTYAGADLLVLASRAETYGMVVTEALARGVPVLAAEVGGVPEALGHGHDGIRPGLLVAPGDPRALSHALRVWLSDAALRARLRAAARQRRASLRSWADTASVLAGVLAGAAA